MGYIEMESKLKAYIKDKDDISSLFDFDLNNECCLEFLKRNFKDIKNEISVFDTSFYLNFLEYVECNDEKNFFEEKQDFWENVVIAAMTHYFYASKDKLLSKINYNLDNLKIKENDMRLNQEKHHSCWYRGQSDYEWNIVPSYLRNSDKLFTAKTIIDRYKLREIYDDYGLIDKWTKSEIGDGSHYHFLAFMQHAVAFSPLVDFTSDMNIAASFALNNKDDFNNFYGSDAAIYELDNINMNIIDDPTKLEKIIEKFVIEYLPKPYLIGEPLLGKPMRSLLDIKEAFTPKFVLVDLKDNDRMTFQKGSFILFYDYVAVKGITLVRLNSDLKLTKYKIKKADKDKIYNELQKNNRYRLNYLLNPYDYFRE